MIAGNRSGFEGVFPAVTNAMYSDSSVVGQRDKLDTPEFYAYMAKAWLNDPDAVKNKACMYYKCLQITEEGGQKRGGFIPPRFCYELLYGLLIGWVCCPHITSRDRCPCRRPK